ncbi:vomeronasal type-2 receptor 116-like [Dipodomys merriami]|uniref:vomeronasal type-2 receptor 116-like n=1 Tax=Dipodomys merriami TaxID=94247 RepID=UPI003855721D
MVDVDEGKSTSLSVCFDSKVFDPFAIDSDARFIFKKYQLVWAMAFAIVEINKNPDLLHNLTVGFDIYEVELTSWSTFKNPFIWLFGKYEIPNFSCMRDSRSIAVLTRPSAITLDQIGTLLELYRFPQFTFGRFDHALNDHHKFPALYQMAPKDTSIATVMVYLLLHFIWNWVGLFTSQDENGSWVLAELKEEMVRNRVYVAYELPVLVRSLAGTSCFSTMKHRAHMDGDVIIAGFFPLNTLGKDHSKSEDSRQEEHTPIFKNYQFVLALVFAVEEINKNPVLLHNMTLGLDIYDVEFRAWTMLKNPFIWLFGKYKIPNYSCMRDRRSTAVLTGPSGITSNQIGTLLGLYRFPQFSFGPFDHALSDHNTFPALYQMAPKDTSMAIAIVSLLFHFNWNWVGLLTSQDENGSWFLAELKEQMAKTKVCVAYELVVSTQDLSYLFRVMAVYNKINNSSASVLIIYGDKDSLISIIMSLEQILMQGKVCVMNLQWDFTMKTRYFMLGSLHVPLVFTQHHVDVSGFTDFVKAVNPPKYPEDIFLARLWFLSFNCSDAESDCVIWDNCPPDTSLDWLPGHIFDMTMSVYSYNIYKTVYAVAQALHEMLLLQTEVHTMGNRKGRVPSPAQLHLFLKNIQYYNPAGDQVIWDEKRKLEPEYDILNIWNFPEGLELAVKVGKFSPYALHGNQLSLSEDLLEWAIGTTETPHSICSESCGPGFRKSRQEEKATCCFDCTPCPENEIANVTDVEQCVKCPDYQYANTERNQCLLKAASFLAFGDPLGMALACMALCFSMLTVVVLGVFVKHKDSAIVKANHQTLSYILLISLIFCFLCSLLFLGHPNTVTCILQQITFGVVFTVAVSTVLAKTVTVVLAFKATSPGRRMRWLLVSGAANFIILICTLIQVTLCGLWLGTSPPFVDTDAYSEHGHIIILCNKGSITAFYCVLGYLGSLALASFTVAFLARNLPDTFNEAKFLTFSMLVFCSVWLTFLPVYHSAKGKAMVAVEIFSILASSAGLLGCIFVPKCYNILLVPNKISPYGFRDKRHSRRNMQSYE